MVNDSRSGSRLGSGTIGDCPLGKQGVVGRLGFGPGAEKVKAGLNSVAKAFRLPPDLNGGVGSLNRFDRITVPVARPTVIVRLS